MQDKKWIVPLFCGLAGGVALIIHWYVVLANGKNPLMDGVFYRFPVVVAFQFAAVWWYRKQNNGLLTLWEGVGRSVIANLTATVVLVIFAGIVISMPNNSIFAEYLKLAEAMVIKNKEMFVSEYNEAHYQMLLEGIAKTDRTAMLIDMAAKIFFSTAIIPSVILSLILQKHPKQG